MSDVDPQYESEPTEVGAGGEEELPELSDYGRRFVESAPEEERQYAEKYVRMWDGGYKKAVGKYEQELSQWKSLGVPHEDAQVSVRLYQTLVNNPQRLLDYLVNDPDGPQLTVAQAKQVVAEEAEKKEVNPLEEKYSKLERAVLALAEERSAERARKEQEREQANFKAELDAAAKTHGEFDVRIVAGMLASGHAQSIDEAVQHYHRAMGKTQRRAAPPNLLGASSAAPSGAKKIDFGKAEAKERVNWLAHALSGDD